MLGTSRGKKIVQMILENKNNKESDGLVLESEEAQCSITAETTKGEVCPVSHSDTVLPSDKCMDDDDMQIDDIMQNDSLSTEKLCNISDIDNLHPLSSPDTSLTTLQSLLDESHLQNNDTVTLSLPVCITTATENVMIDLVNVPVIIYDGNESDNKELEENVNSFIVDEANNVNIGSDEADYEQNDPDYIPTNFSDASNSIEEEHDIQDLQTETANNVQQGRPKKGRKRKFGSLTREERSVKKYRYEEFVNFAKNTVQAKTFVDFNCQCTNKCQDKVPVDIRKKEFEKFKDLGNYNAQNLFINANVKEVPKKRSYVSMKEGVKCRPKSASRIYSLNKVTVCRTMFVKTLCISTKRVNTALCKMKSDSLLDKRGKQAGWNKISDEKLREVKQCIESIPKYTSHYRRSQTTSLFLPPDLNISKMYDLYVNNRPKEEVVSLPTFKKIFYSCYNLKFKSFKKDTCNKCDMYVAKQIGMQDVLLKNAIKAEHDEHLSISEDAQKKLKEDMKYASTTEKVECLTFDMEKTLPLPRVPTNVVFYKRQLWVYNCGIHSGTTNRGYCYTWVEGESGRGAQEVGSCLIKHIANELPEGTEHLILWSDSCGGQNRNIKLVLILKAVLNDHPSLKTITHKFPIPGHSFLPNDDDFGKIENELKRVQYMYCPEDYFSLMEKCKKKKPLTVIRMKKEDFVSTSEVEKKITNRKKSIDNKEVNWFKTRQIVNKKEKPLSIFLSQTFDGSEYEIDIKKRPGRNSDPSSAIHNISLEKLVPLWPNGKPISEAKLKDLKSMFNIIPKCHHDFYKSLMGDNHITDDIDGFDGEPDFEIEDN